MAETQQEKKLYQTLSLCRRAGALVCGFDPALEAVLQGKANLVLTACDASEKTVKRISQSCAGMAQVLGVPLSQEALMPVSRKAVAVYAITDENLAHLCRKQLAACKTTDNEEEISV